MVLRRQVGPDGHQRIETGRAVVDLFDGVVERDRLDDLTQAGRGGLIATRDLAGTRAQAEQFAHRQDRRVLVVDHSAAVQHRDRTGREGLVHGYSGADLVS